MLMLFLIIHSAAIGRSYSPAKFECPDTVAVTSRFSWLFRFVRRRSAGPSRLVRIRRRAGAAFERPSKCFPGRENRPGHREGRRSVPGRLVLERDWLTVRRVNRRAVQNRERPQRCARGFEPQLTRNLLWVPNSSIEDLGRAKTDAPLGVDPR